jgi:hypothetical protein
MALPLPHVIVPDPPGGSPVDADAIQANFDQLKKEFPLSRKNLKIEQPHIVGAAGEPVFQNSWVNFDTTAFHGARFWKDPMGIVHVEGLIKNGTAAPNTIFELPAGYRPSNGHIFVVMGNVTASHRVDIGPTGALVWRGGGTSAYLSLSGIHFKQEA